MCNQSKDRDCHLQKKIGWVDGQTKLRKEGGGVGKGLGVDKGFVFCRICVKMIWLSLVSQRELITT